MEATVINEAKSTFQKIWAFCVQQKLILLGLLLALVLGYIVCTSGCNSCNGAMNLDGAIAHSDADNYTPISIVDAFVSSDAKSK